MPTPEPLRCAFTLIELLVVITIIVILIALLTPALDTAVYQAELATCSAQLKGLGTGAATYAMEHKRFYFHRPAVHHTEIRSYRPRDLNVPFNTGQTQNVQGFDDRPVMRQYVNVQILQCPLSGAIDLDRAVGDAEEYVSGSYSNWIGWKYDQDGQTNTQNLNASRGLLKLSDTLRYDNKEYHVLAGDLIDTNWGEVNASHPDYNGVLTLHSQQAGDNAAAVAGRLETSFTYSHWEGALTGMGHFDLNFVMTDNSVKRLVNQPRYSGKTDNGKLHYVPPYKSDQWSVLGTLDIARGR